jgi:hypothetical protein
MALFYVLHRHTISVAKGGWSQLIVATLYLRGKDGV